MSGWAAPLDQLKSSWLLVLMVFFIFIVTMMDMAKNYSQLDDPNNIRRYQV